MEKKLQDWRDKRRGKVMFSTVIRCYNRCNDLCEKAIFDSATRSGATRKANTWLRERFLQPVKKVDVDNYQYWNCYNIADIEMERIVKWI